jgi:hypothetical protein
MKFASALTITGVLGYLLIEALKVLLAPVAAWLLGVAIVVVKFALISLALLGAVVAAVFAYRRFHRSRAEA